MNNPQPTTDRPPLPQAIDCEKALLSSLFRDPQKTIATLRECRVEPEHFFGSARAKLLKIALELDSAGTLAPGNDLDFSLLLNSLRSDGVLAALGGEPGFADLQSTYVNSFNLPAYCQAITNTATARKLILHARQVIQETQDNDFSVEELCTKWNGLQDTITDSLDFFRHIPSESEEYDMALEEMELIISNKKLPTTTTGFPLLDTCMGGFRPGRYTVIGARPAQGKTALALSMALAAMRDTTIPGSVLFYTLEMAPHELILRLCTLMSGVKPRPHLPKEEFKKLADAMLELKASNLKFVNARSMTDSQIKKDVLYRTRTTPCKLLILDYMQIVRSDSTNPQVSEVDRISRICTGFRDFARSRNIHLLALSQINRAAAKSDKPGMADLKGSGQFEQDADYVLILHRPEPESPDSAHKPRTATISFSARVPACFYSPQETDPDPAPDSAASPQDELPPQPPCPAFLNLDKNRHGPQTTVHLIWYPELMLYEQA